MNPETEEDKTDWNKVYLLVLGFLALQILVYALITEHYTA